MLLPEPLFAQLIVLVLFFCLLIYTSEIILPFLFSASFIRSFNNELYFPCSPFKRDKKVESYWGGAENWKVSIRSIWSNFLANSDFVWSFQKSFLFFHSYMHFVVSMGSYFSDSLPQFGSISVWKCWDCMSLCDEEGGRNLCFYCNCH